MSSVMARTPTVTRQSDFMAAAEEGHGRQRHSHRQAPGRARGAGGRLAPPADGPGGATSAAEPPAPQERESSGAGDPLLRGTGARGGTAPLPEGGSVTQGLAQGTGLVAVAFLPGKRKLYPKIIWWVIFFSCVQDKLALARPKSSRLLWMDPLVRVSPCCRHLFKRFSGKEAETQLLFFMES